MVLLCPHLARRSATHPNRSLARPERLLWALAQVLRLVKDAQLDENVV
jgi:hypothetical protein